jgi:hypothetical protein
MALAETGNEGALNGTTAVDVVTTPGSIHRYVVRNVSVYNGDTVSRIITLIKNMNGTERILGKETLQPGESWIFDKIVVLDATTEKITAKSDATAATTEPTFDAAFADVS